MVSPAQYQQYLQARLNQNTPNQIASPSPSSLNPNSNLQQGQQRNSPVVRTQPLASRSPMPANAQTTPQMIHPQQQTFSYALPQNQYAHLRHAQMMQHSHIAAGGTQATGQQGQFQGVQGNQDQNQAHQNMAPQMISPYPIFNVNYGQMSMNVPMQTGRVQPGYQWPMGMGRGMPVGNMAGHQMQLNAGKPAQPAP